MRYSPMDPKIPSISSLQLVACIAGGRQIAFFSLPLPSAGYSLALFSSSELIVGFHSHTVKVKIVIIQQINQECDNACASSTGRYSPGFGEKRGHPEVFGQDVRPEPDKNLSPPFQTKIAKKPFRVSRTYNSYNRVLPKKFPPVPNLDAIFGAPPSNLSWISKHGTLLS